MVLTVEDVNSVNTVHVNEYYRLDTGNVSLQAFSNVTYDFVIVSHTVSGAEHTFRFEVHNSLWYGGYYFTKSNGEYLDVAASYNGNVLTVVTSESSVCLVLYLCSFASSFNLNRLSSVLVDCSSLYLHKNELGAMDFSVRDLTDNSLFNVSKEVSFGVNSVNGQFVLVELIKYDLQIDLTSNRLFVGMVNRVRLNLEDSYLPNGGLMDNTLLDIIVQYDGVEIPVQYDVVDSYYFDLDLTGKTDDNNIVLNILVNESKYFNTSFFSLELPVSYSGADSFDTLMGLLANNAKIINITGSIEFTSNLVLPRSVYFLCDSDEDFIVDLKNYSITVDKKINARFENINFVNGCPVFIQEGDSHLVLDKCSFENASITDECKGSVVYTLNNANIVTELTKCNILNCPHSIYHCGKLTVRNIKALFNNYNNNIDNDYSAFLTSYEGTVEITNSTFDIDYNTNTLCETQTDIKFAKSLISIGETTVINGMESHKLLNNDTLPLCNAPFNNKCHTYVEYYYPQINDCVITSPVLNKEDSNVCHSVLGQDWVFKNNTQITRKSTGNENKLKKITWED